MKEDNTARLSAFDFYLFILTSLPELPVPFHYLTWKALNCADERAGHPLHADTSIIIFTFLHFILVKSFFVIPFSEITNSKFSFCCGFSYRRATWP